MSKIESYLKKSNLYPIIVLEDFLSSKKRKILIKTTKYLLFLVPIITIINIIISNYQTTKLSISLNLLSQKIIGLFLITIGLYLIMRMIEAYFTSVYYFDHIVKNNYKQDELYTFSAGRILRKVINDNILAGFLRSPEIGQRVMIRLGIKEEEIIYLLKNQSEIKEIPPFDTTGENLTKVSTIANFIYKNHLDFRKILEKHGLTESDLEASVNWVIYDIEQTEYNKHWWTKDRLDKIPSLANDWSFGQTYLLNQYSRKLLNDIEVNSENVTLANREKELQQMQSILNRKTGANIILTGSSGQEKMEVIWSLCRNIKNKVISTDLINKRPILFLASEFCLNNESKEIFEKRLVSIFREALEAGNIILIIDNLPKLIIQAKQFGLNLVDLIEPYIASGENEIIALAETDYFHTLIEKDPALMSQFEVIQVKPLTLDEITKILTREATMIENIYPIYYTYPALIKIAQSSEYYFPSGVSSDKAKDLLAEISPWAIRKGYTSIKTDYVLEYIEEKTNIPTGIIRTEEKEKLLNLENLLMQRVIAQRDAIFSIAGAIRRNRAGIRNEKRPIGSFLFLGPTGVGKTESAKALADIMFNQGNKINEGGLLLRLDMSEFQNEESLSKLIGSQENDTPGILSNMLREHPYGVLLLDEFEKTHQDVLNLFLQIIDEGVFSDAFGKKVIARNIIFIATSNAGADKIFEIISNKEDLKSHENDIISYIIKQGIFKPELINRFDATVLFHPLERESLAKIAELMLKKISKKMSSKGITLIIDKELIDFIVQGGYNPTFGARPMNRFIQDTIEEHLADLLIRQSISSGQKISFKIISNNGNKSDLKTVIIEDNY